MGIRGFVVMELIQAARNREEQVQIEAFIAERHRGKSDSNLAISL